MQNRLKIFLFSFFVLFSISLFSQSYEANQKVNEVMIEANGIRAVSENPFDTITVDVNTKMFYYCFSDSSESFWHKIYVNADCEITFNILPSGNDNIYNYFLYSKKGDVDIKDVLSKSIDPIRANLFKDKMYITGTGLSVASCVSVHNSCSNDVAKDFYHTPYHSAVKAVKGKANPRAKEKDPRKESKRRMEGILRADQGETR